MVPWLVAIAAVAHAAGVGDALPSAALVDASGAPAVIASGRPAVVNLWASWCEPCRIEFPLLDALHDRIGGSGVQVIGVALDHARARPAAVAHHLGLGLTVLYDTGGETARALDPRAMPTTYVVDSHGVIRYVHAGALDATGIAEVEAEIGYLSNP